MTQEPGIPPEFRTYSLEEVSQILNESGRGLTVRTLQDYCKKGQIRAVKVGTSWRVSHANLGLFLNGPELKPAATPPVEKKAPPVPVAPLKKPNPVTKARRALDELKQKLEAERARRQEILQSMPAAGPRLRSATTRNTAESRPLDDPRDSSPVVAPLADATPSDDEVIQGPDMTEIDAEIAGTRGLDEAGRTVDGDQGLDLLDRPAPPPKPASGPGADDFLKTLNAGVSSSRSEMPEEAVEEEEFPGRGLRMTCQLSDDESGMRLRHGVYESWYESGGQAARGEYVRGRLEGPWQQWHENGQLQVVGAHEAGLPQGPWTWWDEQGRKTQELSYERGRLDGLWAQFHPNGRKWCEGRYRDGQAEGSFRYWDLDGRPA